jgi:dihydrofolate reductase
MSKVFVDMSISMDGFIAGPNGYPGNPMGDGGIKLHDYVFVLESWREKMGMPGGETGRDNDRTRHTIDRIGANVLGRRMFDEGEVAWPEEAPFHNDVFIVTHRARDPWVRPGGTTFHFVTDGPLAALERARKAAGGKDVRIGGGASVVRQLLLAGQVDELTLHLTPIVLGGGVRLFDGFAPGSLKLECTGVEASKLTTHIDYRVVR